MFQLAGGRTEPTNTAKENRFLRVVLGNDFLKVIFMGDLKFMILIVEIFQIFNS